MKMPVSTAAVALLALVAALALAPASASICAGKCIADKKIPGKKLKTYVCDLKYCETKVCTKKVVKRKKYGKKKTKKFVGKKCVPKPSPSPSPSKKPVVCETKCGKKVKYCGVGCVRKRCNKGRKGKKYKGYKGKGKHYKCVKKFVKPHVPHVPHVPHQPKLCTNICHPYKYYSYNANKCPHECEVKPCSKYTKYGYPKEGYLCAPKPSPSPTPKSCETKCYYYSVVPKCLGRCLPKLCHVSGRPYPPHGGSYGFWRQSLDTAEHGSSYYSPGYVPHYPTIPKFYKAYYQCAIPPAPKPSPKPSTTPKSCVRKCFPDRQHCSAPCHERTCTLSLGHGYFAGPKHGYECAIGAPAASVPPKKPAYRAVVDNETAAEEQRSVFGKWFF